MWYLGDYLPFALSLVKKNDAMLNIIIIFNSYCLIALLPIGTDHILLILVLQAVIWIFKFKIVILFAVSSFRFS